MTTARQPGLYDPGETPPQLLASRCGACETVAFPAMTIGCEVCGAPAERLAASPIAAAGVLYSVATVHLHHGKDIEAPFTMAEIELDDGPLIRATLRDVVDVASIGQRVHAEWFTTGVDDDGNDVVEPRFVVSESMETAGAAS
jgi:uncharacterized OB-fold protein